MTASRFSDDGATTTLVDPPRFCCALHDECLRRSVQLYQPARVKTVGINTNGILDCVYLEIRSTITAKGMPAITATLLLPCTRLIITAGAWSAEVFNLFPHAQLAIGVHSRNQCFPIGHMASHSLFVRITDQLDMEPLDLHSRLHVTPPLSSPPSPPASRPGSPSLMSLGEPAMRAPLFHAVFASTRHQAQAM